jgi:rSAM/selenodomain-associated transferase 2
LRISIIIPALNEAQVLTPSLTRLQGLRQSGHEVLLVDGGSSDATVSLAAPLVDTIAHAPQGRARQMNAGARLARGDMLIFLHADTCLPEGVEQILRAAKAAAAKAQRPVWGRFDVRLSGRHWLLRVVETLMNMRSRWTGIATGDQAIFVERILFEDARGFPDIPLMEDIALSKTLRAIAPPLCLRARVVTSSRRWETQGIVRTILLMWGMRLAYALGVDPLDLVRIYYRSSP